MNNVAHIPVNEPALTPAEYAAVDDAVRSGWVSSAGKYLDEFEERWASYCDRRYGIAVSSGTTALELAVEALGLVPGDEVIMPTFTIVSCALAVIRAGGIPVLVDADTETWCMDATQLEVRITSRTRAIMPVHIYGHPCDMSAIFEIADRYGLAIIEDAAEAHGAECELAINGGEWRRCGSFGTMSTFSFYANKLVTTGEGGMILTNDATLAGALRSQRNLAFGSASRFEHMTLGHQYRLTNLQAALGVPQIKRMPELLARKRWMAAAYAERLRDIAAITTQHVATWARPMHWMYGILLTTEARFDAVELSHRLATRGVETRPFFLGMHEQPALRAVGLFAGETYPIAERLSRRGLYLPSGLGLTEIQVERVTDALREVFG